MDFLATRLTMSLSLLAFAPQTEQNWCSLRKHNPPAWSFRRQLYRRGICFLPAAKQQIPRAAMPRFGMTILWGFFKLDHRQKARKLETATRKVAN
jgi:hypothetical protein